MAEFKEISIEKLEIDPTNLRPGPGICPEFIDSIRAEGVLEPLVVRPRGEGYGVVIGGRRLVAARHGRLKKVPCVIRHDLKDDDERAKILSFKENEHREDIPSWKKKEIIQKNVQQNGGGKRMSEEEENMAKKTFDFYLLFNWKTGDVRVRKTEPKKSDIAASVIPIHTTIDVVVPKEPEYEAKGTVRISEKKLEDLVFDAL